MRENKEQIGEIVARTRPSEGEDLDGKVVEQVLELQLSVREDGEEGREIDLPPVRFVESTETGDDNLDPYGPDRAEVWKKTGEWIQQLAIKSHPTIKEKTYENRVKAEESYVHGKDQPDYYEWQEDEETLVEIRPKYRGIKQELIDQIGRPTREDFDDLYPHKYDDPGLSEHARRTVRDLKAVFGQDIVVQQRK